MFNCSLCNFKSKRQIDLNRHCETKKHKTNTSVYKNKQSYVDEFDEMQNNVNNVQIKNNETCQLYVCNVCDKKYKHRQTLSKHKKICNKKNEPFKEVPKTIEMLSTEIQTLKSELHSMYLNKQKIEKKPVQYNNTVVMTNNNNTILNDNKIINNQKTINVVAYINSNYPNVEPLKQICKDQISKMISMAPEQSGNHSFCDFLIFNYEKGLLHQFLGKLIISVYKKEDPEEQQFWATDVARLTFIVRQILNNDKHAWITDKKGTHIIDYIITPFLDELLVMLINYIKLCKLSLEEDTQNVNNVEKYGNKIYIAREINLEITLCRLHQKILTYIIPKFQLGTNQIYLK